MSYVYLASPYSDPDSEVRQARYEAVCEYLVCLTVIDRLVVFSPIVHWHEVAKKFDLPFKAKDYRRSNEVMLKAADGLQILMLDGWDESKGIQEEFDFALKHKIYTLYVVPRRADGTLVAERSVLDAASVR